MQDALEEHARAWVDADAPVLWLLGKTQAGKTSIVAEVTGQGHDEVGRGYRPMTLESRVYAFPPEQPVLRFLDTRGLADSTDNDPGNELALLFELDAGRELDPFLPLFPKLPLFRLEPSLRDRRR